MRKCSGYVDCSIRFDGEDVGYYDRPGPSHKELGWRENALYSVGYMHMLLRLSREAVVVYGRGLPHVGSLTFKTKWLMSGAIKSGELWGPLIRYICMSHIYMDISSER